MKKILLTALLLYALLSTGSFISCKGKDKVPSGEAIKNINLVRGDLISCGPPGKNFGTVSMAISCPEKLKKDFNLGVALLHSFEYEEAEKVFAKIIDQNPDCAMPYWGVAMSNFHQLWPSPPSPEALEKGRKVIAVARSLTRITERESDYINAIALFYKDWPNTSHSIRAKNFEKAMEQLHKKYPGDKEAAVFYALSLNATVDPADKTFANQRKAGAILSGLYPGEPDHPGIVHYIIHTYDYPELASLALSSARKYAAIAPSSAHAQHMPSHIFTRLGLWDECIQSNLVSTASAKCYAELAGINGHWDEELHGMDYLVYAYLQKGDNTQARKQLDYLMTIDKVYPVNFKDAYAFAAIPSRYFLENKMWKEAAGMELFPADFPWEKFPWQKAIVHFTRLMGAVHQDKLDPARNELKILRRLNLELIAQNDPYKARQVMIQVMTGEAWILFKENKMREAKQQMQLAVDMELKTEKSPVTPGAVIPAMEWLADLYLQANDPGTALECYRKDLKKQPNRFNGIYGAAIASARVNDIDNAVIYYRQLLAMANGHGGRPEIIEATSFLKKHVP